MKKIDLGQTITILANIGVLLGIALLAYELNQNRQSTESQTRMELSNRLTEIMLLQALDPEVSEFVRRATSGEPLSESEALRFSQLSQVHFRYHENVHYQYRNGLYDENEFGAQLLAWRGSVYANEARVKVWCRVRTGYSPEFVAQIDQLLTTYKCD